MRRFVYLPALRMGTRYFAKVSGVPCDLASVTMKVIGTYIPPENQNQNRDLVQHTATQHKGLLTKVEKEAQTKQEERQLAQRPDELHGVELPSRGRNARPHHDVGENQEHQDEEATDANRPPETNFRNQVNEHDGQDHAAERGAHDDDSESHASFLLEPRGGLSM